MPTQAWPYAVADGWTSDYQKIVVPSFLADAEQAYLLWYAIEGEVGEPGVATVRDVLGVTSGPLSLVCRVVVAGAAPYEVDGEVPLRDRLGRIVRIFEGLVFQIPAAQVASLGLIVNDLDAVTAMTVPIFRRLWTASGGIDPEPSTAISVGNTLPGTQPLNLRIVEAFPSYDVDNYAPKAAYKTTGFSWLLPAVLAILAIALVFLIIR